MVQHNTNHKENLMPHHLEQTSLLRKHNEMPKRSALEASSKRIGQQAPSIAGNTSHAHSTFGHVPSPALR